MDIIAISIAILALLVSFFFSFFNLFYSRLNKLSDHITEIDKIMVKNPELLSIFCNEEMEKNRSDISFSNRMSAFILLHFNVFESAYFQVLSKRTMFFSKQKSAWNNFISVIFKTNFVNEMWGQYKKLYDENFTKYIDTIRDSS